MIREMISNGQSRSRKLRYRATVGYSVARGVVFTKSTSSDAGEKSFSGYSLQWTTEVPSSAPTPLVFLFDSRGPRGACYGLPLTKLDESSLYRSFWECTFKGIRR